MRSTTITLIIVIALQTLIVGALACKVGDILYRLGIYEEKISWLEEVTLSRGVEKEKN